MAGALSVIIPAHNPGPRLRDLLHRLAAESPASAEIIVVDDGSTDGTAELAAGPGGSRFRVIRQPRRGRAAARNAGARAAAGSALLFLDADVRPAPGITAAHLRHHADGAAAAVQGRVRPDPAALTTTFMRARHLYPDLTVRRRARLSPMHLSAANLSVSAEAFHRIGGFDETFSGYGWEDVDLGWRLARAGVLLRYEPAAAVWHDHIETLEELLPKWRENGAGAVALWRKHGRAPWLGLLLEVAPVLLPLKRLVYQRSGLAGLVRAIRPWAERAGCLPLCSECYNFLLWQAFYEGVFAALAQPGHPAAGPVSRKG